MSNVQDAINMITYAADKRQEERKRIIAQRQAQLQEYADEYADE